MDPVAERVARNESIFRDANARIARAAEDVVDSAPFICECAQPSCTTILELRLDEYRAVRDNGRQFVNAPGHEAASEGWGVVVARAGHYVVVEKIGEAGELAERLQGDE